MSSLFPPGYIPIPKYDSPYHYIPTRWITILFVVLFSLTAGAHGFQAFRYKIWWMWPTLFVCGLTEVIGWAGRVWSSKNPWIMDPFLMQICCTIIAPTFMTAGMFFMFGRIIGLIGYEYSRLTPKAYAYIFIGFDFVALVVQAVGGAMASTANTESGSNNGAHIMVGGIIVQMAAITFYLLVQTEYLIRVFKDKPIRPVANAGAVPLGANDKYEPGTASTSLDKFPARERITPNIGQMLIGLAIATVFIYVRSIYRTIELLDGWNGPIISNERLFNTLDGMPIFLAMFTLNVFHPGRLIPLSRAKLNAV